MKKRTSKKIMLLLLLNCTSTTLFSMDAIKKFFGYEQPETGYRPLSASPEYDPELAIGQSIIKGPNYIDVGEENLRSLAGTSEPKIPHTTGGKVAAFIKRQKAIILGLAQRKKINITFDILNNHEKKHLISSSIIDKTTWRDLNLLNGNPEQPNIYLGSIINQTQTALGKAYLLGTIARPISDIEELKKRKEITQALESNGNILAKHLDLHLKYMAATEPQLLGFWSGLSLPGTVSKQYWDIHQKLDTRLNRSPWALTLKSGLSKIQKCSTTAMQAGTGVLFTAYSLYFISNLLFGMPIPAMLEAFATRFIASSGPIYGIAASLNPSLQCTASLFSGAFNLLGIKNAIAWTGADLSIDVLLQGKIVKVARYIKEMEEIHKLLKTNPLSQKMDNFMYLTRCLHNPELKQLFSTLASPTFKVESNFFDPGKMLLALELLQDKKIQKALEPGLAAIAEIDMYTSVAKLHSESKNKKLTYCFPDYEKGAETPHIQLTKYWNPFIESAAQLEHEKQNIVVNTTELGGKTEQRNAIITGPNSAGKTATMEGITLAIILAQSIGIAPATHMKFTPFSHVASYMGISGSTTEKTSLFQAEVDRVVKLQKKIPSLYSSGKFSFTMFDEIFSGTSPAEGVALAYATAQIIGSSPNSICVIATHFQLLTNLEKTTTYFTNYKVSVAENKGRLTTPIKRLYKLEKGISKQHIALEVARERGTEGPILHRAKELLNQLKKNPSTPK